MSILELPKGKMRLSEEIQNPERAARDTLVSELCSWLENCEA